MTIIWHGMSCFEINVIVGKGERVTILIDPLDEGKCGIKMPKIDADIVLITNKIYTTHAPEKIKSAFLIDCPGEYEIKGVYIQGIASLGGEATGKTKPEKNDKTVSAASTEFNTIFSIEAEEMQICHLGSIQQAELSQDQTAKISNVDILMCPVGNGISLDAKAALKIMSQIEPSIVIPMTYAMSAAKVKLTALEEFLKEAGVGKIEPLSKLLIKKKEINPEEAKIIVLNA